MTALSRHRILQILARLDSPFSDAEQWAAAKALGVEAWLEPQMVLAFDPQ